MKFCKRCLYSEEHPLFLTIGNDGLCSGCKVHEEKVSLDWKERELQLKEILSEYKNHSGNNYDCIVPVSGGKESFFIVHTLKKKYGLNPLLVTYNKQYNTEIGIRNLAKLRIELNCDIMTLTVNPEVVKKITRATLRRFGSVYWHCLAGQTVYPVQIAVKFKIPLIVWGAHQGIEQVGMFSHLDNVEMTRKYRKEHDLMGYEAEDLIDSFDDITESDIFPFRYPDDKEIERIGVRGIYLGNFIRWDLKVQHEEMLAIYQYGTVEQNRTFDTYSDVDCFNYSDIHDYTKFLKQGFGKVTDHVCREIRYGRLTREEGLVLIKKYFQKAPIHLKKFLEWIGITESGFHFILDQHRNKKYWHRNDNWDWEFNHPILGEMKSVEDLNLDCDTVEKKLNFRKTLASTGYGNEYILIGKGHG
ncbi:N-acetyl sugar amidotransferase [Leptospira kanakyensis]|uniref:N-acetyl sugar amidotransferase n=1 Tax=Leptospira kanakyensis TaxID=2484968 RepID=UPI00223E76D9|nr:N-acetyl sugar amidotransferase [Leptospira kanakyensis]MCW7471392.1 N-acetyl sugar amidotransferase [Leptospira kanakyensis]